MGLSGTDLCLHCGTRYTKGRKWQEYCSRICKEKAFYIRKADEAKEELNVRKKNKH